MNLRNSIRLVGAATTVLLAYPAACSPGDDSTFKVTGPDGGGDDGGGSSSGGVACTIDAGPPSPADFAGQPDCPATTCTISGTLAGQTVMKSYPRKDNVFNLSCGPSTGGVDVHFGTNGTVHADLTCPVPAGQTVAATTITLTMPTEGPMPGATLTSSDFERFDEATANEYRFLLRCMSSGALGGGGPVDGTLYVCCAK